MLAEPLAAIALQCFLHATITQCYLFILRCSYYIVLPCTVALANLRRCYEWHQQRQPWSPARFDRDCAGPGTMSLLQFVVSRVFWLRVGCSALRKAG